MAARPNVFPAWGSKLLLFTEFTGRFSPSRILVNTIEKLRIQWWNSADAMVPFAQWTEQFLSLFLIHSEKLSPVTGGEQWTVENGERGFFPRNSFQRYRVMGRLVNLSLFLIMISNFSQICKSSVTRNIYGAEFSNSPCRCCAMFFKRCLFVTSIIQLSSLRSNQQDTNFLPSSLYQSGYAPIF